MFSQIPLQVASKIRPNAVIEGERMRAAIYARKSTDNEQGVDRQVELAKDFIATHPDWTVAEGHIYRDNDISGATFNRPGLNAMLAALRAQPRAFDVLVMMDASRLGRDMEETLPLQGTITRAGVRIWHYQERQELLLSTPVQKLVASVANFSHEDFRYQIQRKTAAALRKKAEQGHVASGKVYGYRNVKQGVSGDRHTHVLREIDPAEAQVVRRVFTMTVEGLGFLKIARALNADGIRSPRGGGWGTTTLREMLNRELYRGRDIYGKTQRGSKAKTKVKRPESEWVVHEKPELRIVSDELWQAAHARVAKTRGAHTGYRKDNGQLEGRPESGLVSRHLLAGFLRCGICGSNMFVISRASRAKRGGETGLFFLCQARHKTGSRSCTNRYALPYARITEAVLDHYRQDFLRPEVIGGLLTKEIHRREQDPALAEAERQQAQTDIKRLDRELAQLAEAVATGGTIPALVRAMQEKQRQRDTLAAHLEHLDGLVKAAESWDVGAWVEETRELLEDLQDTLEADPAAGRGVLRQLMLTPIIVSPVLDDAGGCIGWDYQGAGAMDRVLAGRLPWGSAGQGAGPLIGWTTAQAVGRPYANSVGSVDDPVDKIGPAAAQVLSTMAEALEKTSSNCAQFWWERGG